MLTINDIVGGKSQAPAPVPEKESWLKTVGRAVLPKAAEEKLIGPKPGATSAPVSPVAPSTPKTLSLSDIVGKKEVAPVSAPSTPTKTLSFSDILSNKPVTPVTQETPTTPKEDGFAVAEKTFGQKLRERGWNYSADMAEGKKPVNFIDEKVKEFLNKPEAQEIVKTISSATANLPLKAYARLKSLGSDTYEEAYNKGVKYFEDPESSTAKKFLYQVQNTVPQTAIGVLLSVGSAAITRNPVVGETVAGLYWSSLSADEQLQERGKVESLGNIAIDTVGDRLLGSTIEGLFKSGRQVIERTLKSFALQAGKTATVEGGTEVAQTLLKNANDYRNANTPEERAQIVDKTKEYVRSGDILMEFGVGGVAGAGIGVGAMAVAPKEPTATKPLTVADMVTPAPAPVAPQTPETAPSATENIPAPVSTQAPQKAKVEAEIESNIKQYKRVGGFDPSSKGEDPMLRDLNSALQTEEGANYAKQGVDSAIATGKLEVKDDGKITVYRAGPVRTENALSSFTTSEEVAQRFKQEAEAAGRPGEITKLEVSPEEIGYFIGGGEAEVLLKTPKVEAEVPMTGAKAEFKVGDVLDTKGGTNMVGNVTIREIKGNTLLFTDSQGNDFAGMSRSTVHNLVNGGSWARVNTETANAPVNTTAESGLAKLYNWEDLSVEELNTIWQEAKGFTGTKRTPGNISRLSDKGKNRYARGYRTEILNWFADNQPEVLPPAWVKEFKTKKPAKVKAPVQEEKPVIQAISEKQKIVDPLVKQGIEEIKTKYKSVENAEEALNSIREEMEFSEAGYRYMIPGTDEFKGVPSTFPQWVPENLRKTELFKKVFDRFQNIDSLEYPPARNSAQVELFDEVLKRLDSALGVDNSGVRSAIMSLYGKVQSSEESITSETADSIFARRSEPRGGIDVEEISKLFGAGPTVKLETQKEAVKKAVAEGPKTIKQVAEETNILEPNVRRILGVGAKEGTFERVEKGVYVLKDKDGNQHAWIEAGDAVSVLPRMVEEGRKFDSIILDPAYFSRALIGGNRGIKQYEFILPDEFKKVMDSVSSLVSTPDSHVYLMLSGARTAQPDMLRYANAASDAGFKVVGEGKYQKLFQNGDPVTNVRGEVAAAERLILFTKSGEARTGEIPVSLDFQFIRPSIKTSYSTEKPGELIRALIKQSTLAGESVLDPFAGSGVTGAEALKAGRKPTLIEKNPAVVEERVKPRLESALPKTPETPSGFGSPIYQQEDGTEIPVLMGGISEIKPIEFPELVDLARELTGTVPEIVKKTGKAAGRFYASGSGRIKLITALFTKNNTMSAAQVLAHEIGHLIDYLPERTLSRGNLVGRLYSLREHLKGTFGDGEITNKKLREELLAVTKYWHPYDPGAVPESYRKYRESSVELYADAISMLFNTPGMLERMAPTFYNEFFASLDRKTDVKTAYFELQDLLSLGRDALIERRRAGVQQMFSDADYKAKELAQKKEAERKARYSNALFQFKLDVISRNQAVIDKVNELEKRGTYVNPDENPVYYLRESNYLGGKIKAFFESNIQPIYKTLTENNITWGTFGEALMYERIIAGDRSEVANPRGLTPESATELYDNLKQELGDKLPVFEKQIADFRKTFRNLAEEAYQEGLYKPELYQTMLDNPAYAPYQVVEYLENNVTWKVKAQVGTLKDINNPANAAMLKAISTMRAIERNKVSRVLIKFWETNFASEILPADMQKTEKGQFPMEPKDKNLGLVTYYDQGQLQGSYVDKYVTESFERNTILQNNFAINALRFLNSKQFRPLFITYNVGFQSFNFVRDFVRFWKNIPATSFWQANKQFISSIARYKQALPIARVRAFGMTEDATEAQKQAFEVLKQMEKEQILSITYNDVLNGREPEDAQIDEILVKLNLGEATPKTGAFSTFLEVTRLRSVLEFIERLGNYIETLPKVAGYFELKGKMPAREMRDYLRRNIGSPDFLDGGRLKPAMNEVFLFSNSIVQGITSDLQVATSPKTRGGYWYKTVVGNLLPKILMFAAAVGLMGDDLEDMFRDASEYDKTNYTVVPLGKDESGEKTVYLRLPQDESGRLFGGILWKTLRMLRGDAEVIRSVFDIVSYTGGQIPSVTPVIESIAATTQFVSGQNPYDTFRGRYVLTDDQFRAGGLEALKGFAMWQFEQLGGGVFYKFYSGETLPKEMSTGEKILRLPVVSNIVGRWVRVSNYGKIEEYRKVIARIEKENSRENIQENKMIADYLGKFQETGKAPGDKAKIIQQLRIEATAGMTGQEKMDTIERVIKKFNLATQKGSSDPRINAMVSANTNEEKAALLKVFKETMAESEFMEIRRLLLKEKIISGDVIMKLNSTK